MRKKAYNNQLIKRLSFPFNEENIWEITSLGSLRGHHALMDGSKVFRHELRMCSALSSLNWSIAQWNCHQGSPFSTNFLHWKDKGRKWQ